MKTLLLAFLILAPLVARAVDESEPVEIEVVNASSRYKEADKLAYLVKEKIRASKGARLTTSDDNSHVRIILTTALMQPGDVLLVGITTVQTIPTRSFSVYLSTTLTGVTSYSEDTVAGDIVVAAAKAGQDLRDRISYLQKHPEP